VNGTATSDTGKRGGYCGLICERAAVCGTVDFELDRNLREDGMLYAACCFCIQIFFNRTSKHLNFQFFYKIFLYT
jgi:hypothetical protein